MAVAFRVLCVVFVCVCVFFKHCGMLQGVRLLVYLSMRVGVLLCVKNAWAVCLACVFVVYCCCLLFMCVLVRMLYIMCLCVLFVVCDVMLCGLLLLCCVCVCVLLFVFCVMVYGLWCVCDSLCE